MDYYNAHNQEIEYNNIKFHELWNEWQNTKENSNLTQSTLNGYNFAFSKIPTEIKEKTFKHITYKDLELMFENMKKNKVNHSTIAKVKNSLSQLYRYASKVDITEKNLALLVDIGKAPIAPIPLTLESELDDIIARIDTSKGIQAYTLKIVLMLCLNGCRINEFLNLKTEDIDLKNSIIYIRQSKTEAGVRRIPIHNEVYEIYSKLYNEDNTYFLTRYGTNKKISYQHFLYNYWNVLKKSLDWNEELTPHNCRKTCASLLRRFNVNSTYQKLILGHNGAL